MMATDSPPSQSSSLETSDMAFACLYLLLFFIAFLFNSVSAWVSLNLGSTSTFVVYLKNLVAADLLVTLCLPVIAASKLPGVPGKLVISTCSFVQIIFISCLYVNVSLMGLISLDRYFKVVRPHGRLLGQSVTFSLVSSTLVWVVIFGGAAVPSLVGVGQVLSNTTGKVCISSLSSDTDSFQKFVILFTYLLFWLISAVIVFCYICITLKVLQSFRNSGSNNSQGRRRTKLRVFLILLEFFLCFVPLHLIRIPSTLLKLFDSGERSVDESEMIMSDLFLWMSTANVCLDPLLYISLCREYRNKLVELMEAAGICVGLCSSENEDVSLEMDC